MNVKIDTKDKFTEFTCTETNLTANMAEEIISLLKTRIDTNIPHCILNMGMVENLEDLDLKKFTYLKEKFIEADASLVFCCLQPKLYKQFDDLEVIDFLNVTPTLSEAWDIVQMEEIERELMNDFDEDSE